MNPLVLYHGGCFDGFCGVWLFTRTLLTGETAPVQYGQPPPDVKGRDVFLVDFCYPLDVLTQIAEDAASLTILDHHKSAKPDLIALRNWASWEENGPEIVFDVGKSGARLAWEYLYERRYFAEVWQQRYTRDRAPWLVDYTEDRDLWRWKLPHSKEINACLRSFPFEFVLWDKFSQEAPDWMIAEGKAILRREQQMVESHLPFAREVTLCGVKGLAVNATVLHSEIGQALAQQADFGAVWFVRQDGKEVWSLRSREGGIDVSQLAQQLGGGGHHHAAGFEKER